MTVDSTLEPWAGAAAASGAFGLLMTGLWLLGPSDQPERRRKLFHGGAGLIALTLPWLIATRWCAVALLSATTMALLAVRVVPTLRTTLGAALHSVGRRTHGEFYFAVAVLILFLAVPHGGPRYLIPLVILVVADPVAALVGISYGRHHLTGWARAKTVEGCLACFVTAGLATGIMLILEGHPVLAAVSPAIVVAIAVTTAEASGTGGSDNLLVPTATFLVLGPLLGAAVLPKLVAVAAVAVAARLAIGLVGPTPLPPRPAPHRGKDVRLPPALS